MLFLLSVFSFLVSRKCILAFPPNVCVCVCFANVLNSRLTVGNKTYQKRGWRRGGVDCLVNLGDEKAN